MIEFDHEAEDTASSRSARMKRRHREVLAIACTVWLLAFLLREGPNGRVAVRGLAQFPLPQTCASRVIFGMRCPGCGLTRSIIHVAEGDWRASWHDHRVGGLLAVVIALQIPYRLYALRRPGRRLLSTFWLSAIGYGLIAMLVINWLFDVAAGRLTSP
jgi:O-antigen ligase